MKIAFCTCVQIGLSCMEAIIQTHGNLDLIISLPDNIGRRKSGRIFVDDFANANKIPVLKVPHINDAETIDYLKEYKIDWLFVIGWSQIASKQIISTPTFGVIGAHPTLLPEGRGRAAIPWAILKGLNKTGVTFFKMNEGVDTGLIIEQEVIQISHHETATTLYSKVNYAHEILIKKLYPKLLIGDVDGKIQDESLATYWEGRKPEDGQFGLSMSVEEVDRIVRATTRPYPGAYIFIDNKKYIVWSGKTGSHHGKCYSFLNGFYTFLDFEIH